MAFESLTDRLAGVFKKLRGHGKLSEADIKAAMREVRMALLEADVNYKVAKDFCAKVSERAMGQEVMESLTHGTLGDLGTEILGNLVVDIGFQQGHPHLAHGGFDVGLGQLAVAAQLFEHTGKAVGQRFKCHVRCSSQNSNGVSSR